MANESPEPAGNMNSWLQPGANNAKLIYILYLVSFVFGLTSIIGVVFAYVNRGQSEDWIEGHYTYQIRTFWIGILYAVIAIILAALLVGFLLFFLVAIWVIARCVIGLQKAARNEPVANPKTWWI